MVSPSILIAGSGPTSVVWLGPVWAKTSFSIVRSVLFPFRGCRQAPTPARRRAGPRSPRTFRAGPRRRGGGLGEARLQGHAGFAPRSGRQAGGDLEPLRD